MIKSIKPLREYKTFLKYLAHSVSTVTTGKTLQRLRGSEVERGRGGGLEGGDGKETKVPHSTSTHPTPLWRLLKKHPRFLAEPVWDGLAIIRMAFDCILEA